MSAGATFLVVSDLHTDRHADLGRSLLEDLAPADILVVAGDLCDGWYLHFALDLCRRKYADVVFVPGNHEHWGLSIGALRQSLDRYRASSHRDGLGRLHVLDNDTCEIGGVRFVGTTLWFQRTHYTYAMREAWSDFRYIRCRGGLTIYEENERARAFLKATVRDRDVVITHHAPSVRSAEDAYAGRESNAFYVSDVSDVIAERRPALWIHGHMHESKDYLQDDTRVVCNPFGYPHEPNSRFREDLVFRTLNGDVVHPGPPPRWGRAQRTP